MYAGLRFCKEENLVNAEHLIISPMAEMTTVGVDVGSVYVFWGHTDFRLSDDSGYAAGGGLGSVELL